MGAESCAKKMKEELKKLGLAYIWQNQQEKGARDRKNHYGKK
jgi:hypothetical protein